MKKSILMAALCLIGTQVIAQENEEIKVESKKSKVEINVSDTTKKEQKVIVIKTDSDTITFNIPNKTKTNSSVKKEAKFKDGIYMDLGFNTLLDKNGFDLSAENKEMELRYGKSIGVNLGYMASAPLIKSGGLNFIYGLGFEFANYRLKSNNRITTDTMGTLVFTENPGTVNKNKLGLNYINAPLMLQIKTNPRKNSKSVNIAVGAEFAYLLGGRQKLKYELDGKSQKDKVKDDFRVQPFKASLVARAGIGNFELFARYSADELFRGPNNPSVTPLMIGINVFGIN